MRKLTLLVFLVALSALSSACHFKTIDGQLYACDYATMTNGAVWEGCQATGVYLSIP